MRFKLDRGALVTFALYTAAFIVRTVNILQLSSMPFWLYNIIQYTCSLCIWGALYHFVFEMRQVQNKIEKDSVYEYHSASEEVRKQRLIIIGSLAVYGVAY